MYRVAGLGGLEVIDDSPPVLITGPSGSGLTTFTDLLLQHVLGDHRFQHAKPLTDTVVGLHSPFHTELDCSSFSALDDLQHELKQLRETTVWWADGRRHRRLLILYRFHACSFPHELLAALANLHDTHWVVVVSHAGHLGAVSRLRDFLAVRLAAPTADEIRAHWTHVAATSSTARELAAHWARTPDALVPRDWSLMYDQSRAVIMPSSAIRATPSIQYSLRDPKSINDVVTAWLSHMRQTTLPRLGVRAAVSGAFHAMERAGLSCSTPIQVAVWKYMDEHWSCAIAPFANGQRSWTLFLVLFCALVLHQPPFVRQFLPGIDQEDAAESSSS